MKKSVVFSIVVITIFLSIINLTSAADFVIGDMLETFDPQSVLLITVFIIMFTVLFFITSKFFGKKRLDGTHEPNKVIAGVISLAIAFFTMYGAYQYGFGTDTLNLDFQLFSGLWGIIIPIILLAGLIYLIKKMKIESLLVVGLFFLIISLVPDLVFEQEVMMWWGIIIIIMYLIIKFLWWLINRKKKEKDPYTGRDKPPTTKQIIKDQETKKHIEKIYEEIKRLQEQLQKLLEKQQQDPGNQEILQKIEEVQNRIQELENKLKNETKHASTGGGAFSIGNQVIINAGKQNEQNQEVIKKVKKRSFDLNTLKQKYAHYQFLLQRCRMQDIKKARNYYKTLQGLLQYAVKKHRISAEHFLSNRVARVNAVTPMMNYRQHLGKYMKNLINSINKYKTKINSGKPLSNSEAQDYTYRVNLYKEYYTEIERLQR